MLQRPLLLLGIALCGLADAAATPQIELTARPAWTGWSRPGRAGEVDIRLSTDAATAATLDVVAGRQSAHAELDLQPGKTLRLHVPVGPAERVVVSVRPPGGTAQRVEIDVSRSESPLLGAALAAGGTVQLDGFHTLALAADDLPRTPSAYSSIDALILDAATLRALDQRQLGALLGRAAPCGRIVVVHTDPQVRRLLDGAGDCGGHGLMSADSLNDALELLASSLADAKPQPMAPGDIGEWMAADRAAWNGVAVALAIYFAAAALVSMFTSRVSVLCLTPALYALAGMALLQAMKPAAQLVVWSEAASGAQLARYQAWHQLAGTVREPTRMRIPPQLAANVRPCDADRDTRFEFDAKSGQFSFAEFQTRLFHQVSLCYSGSFPMSRAMAIEARQARNTGPTAWPQGLLLLDGRVRDLPALGPGAQMALPAGGGHPPDAPAQRLAMMRIRPGQVAALWPLELGGVGDIPADSTGWLLVTAASP